MDTINRANMDVEKNSCSSLRDHLRLSLKRQKKKVTKMEKQKYLEKNFQLVLQ